jgi:hypothetical protein
MDFWSSEHCLEQSLDIVEAWTPVVDEIEQVDLPASSKERIVFF